MALSAREGAAELFGRCTEEGERQPSGAAAVSFPLYAPLHVRLPVDGCCQAPVGRVLDTVPLLFPLDDLAGVYGSAVQDVAEDGHAEGAHMCTWVRKAADCGR
jgi:hypothetical protein